MNELPTIGNVIRQWRKYAGINLTTFAKQAGMSKGYISALENNTIKNPSPENLERLAAAIGLPIRELLARKLPPNKGSHSTRQTSSSIASQQAEPPAPPWRGADFSFASPLKSSPQVSEQEQLHRILAHIDELRGMIVQLLDQKGHTHE